MLIQATLIKLSGSCTQKDTKVEGAAGKAVIGEEWGRECDSVTETKMTKNKVEYKRRQPTLASDLPTCTHSTYMCLYIQAHSKHTFITK